MFVLLQIFFFFEGTLCSFGEDVQTQNFDIHNIHEVKIQAALRSK